MAAKEFIVGGVDANWSTAGNWNPANKPAAGDTVTINAAVSSMVINEATVVIASIDMTGAAAAFVLSGTGALNCSGNITYKASSTTTMTHSGTITISGNCTFTSNGMTLGSAITSSTAAVTLTLADALNIAAKTLTIGRGTLATGNFNITCGLFTDGAVAAAKTLTLGTSVITCTNHIFSGTAPTVTNTTHTITINSDIATAANFAGKAWGIVNFKSNASAARAHAITFGTGASFVEFNIDQLTDRRDVSLSFSGDFSVASSSTWKSGGIGNDDPTVRLLIKSSAIGTARTMTVSAASKIITLTDVDLQDIKIADTNTPTVSLTRVGDTGGNTKTTGGGYIKDVSDPKTVYLDAGTGHAIYYEGYWAATSGGGADINNFPLPQDTAILDNLSWDDSTNRLYLEGRVGNIDASALTESDLVYLGHSVYPLDPTIYGSIILTGSGVGSEGSNAETFFDSRVKGELSAPLILNNVSFGNNNVIIDSYGGTVQLATAIGTLGTFTLTRGTLDLNGQTLTTKVLSSSNSNTRKLHDDAVGGGGKIIVTQVTGAALTFATDTSLTIEDAPDITFGTSALTLTTPSVTIDFGSTVAKTFGDLAFKKHAGDFPYAITGTGNTFGAVTQETPDAAAGSYPINKVTWPSGSTNTVASYDATGAADSQIFITGSADHSTLSDSAGTNTFVRCTIQNMDVAGGAIWQAYTADGNVDVSGNSGWTWAAGGLSIPVAMHHYNQLRRAA